MSTAEQTKGVERAAPVEALETQFEKDDATARPREIGVAEPEAKGEEEEALALAPLSAYQFRQYNRLAEHMNSFVSLPIYPYIYLPRTDRTGDG